MSTETIWGRIRRRPFHPFFLQTSGGRRYPVFHPEMILLTKTSIAIALTAKGLDSTEEVPSRMVTISPLHVSSVENMPEPKPKTRRKGG